ncbi:MAG: hypothetical protein DWQ37_17900 [Planctomycetota bacterium]|nr:MAG: hypothetical protein DWQ37_17900 [Planctomycetota bacterium]
MADRISARSARARLHLPGFSRRSATILLQIALLTISVLPTTFEAGDVEAKAKAALDKLPGHTGFLFTELTASGPQVLYGINQDERFAVGSSFKLFILGTLADEVNGDRRGLDNVMRLRADWKGPPHSEMADWPVGSPVTLQTLSLKMITISDNTATDHLIHLLGREQIENQMTTMGNRNPEWNRPLLTTREMTLLRDKNTGVPGHEYQELDEAGRREFLAKRLREGTNYEDVDFDTAAYDAAEWYATPIDMARALDWIKNHTEENEAANPLRGVLAVETKLPPDQPQWPYIGFKGGSEDQLLCGNWLLKNKNGRWYTFHVYYNNPDSKTDQQQTLDTIHSLFEIVTEAVEQ